MAILFIWPCVFWVGSMNPCVHEATDDAPRNVGSPPISHLGSASLPDTYLTIIVNDRIAGTRMNATVGFGFNVDADAVGVGYDQYPLQVDNGIDAVPVSGVSYSQRREYPFAYAGTREILDSWASGKPISATDNPAHPFPLWDTRSQEGQYVGPIRNECVPQMTVVGYVLEYDNLTLCFDNGGSLVFGPGVTTIGANFTHLDDEWSVYLIIDMPGVGGTAINGSVVTISLDGHIPIDPSWVPTSVPTTGEMQTLLAPVSGIVALVAVVTILIFSRIRTSLQQYSSR